MSIHFWRDRPGWNIMFAIATRVFQAIFLQHVNRIIRLKAKPGANDIKMKMIFLYCPDKYNIIIAFWF